MDLFIASPPGRVVNTVRGCRRTPTRGQLEGVGFVPQLALPYGPVIGDIVDVLRAWEAAVPILIKPFLYVIAFRPIAVLFASAIGLVCWLLIMCVRAIAWLPTTGQRPRNSANLPRRRTTLPHLCGFARCTQSPPRQRPAGATMPGADAPRQPTAVACDEKRSLSDARRALAGRTER